MKRTMANDGRLYAWFLTHEEILCHAEPTVDVGDGLPVCIDDYLVPVRRVGS